MNDKELKIYDIITGWLTYYEYNFSQLGKERNEEEINKLNVAKKEIQDLEKFTRLVIDKRVAMDLITNEEVKDFIKYNSHCDKYDFIVPLTEEEFNFIREMIEKYGR
jgi:hypothetical protein